MVMMSRSLLDCESESKVSLEKELTTDYTDLVSVNLSVPWTNHVYHPLKNYLRYTVKELPDHVS